MSNRKLLYLPGFLLLIFITEICCLGWNQILLDSCRLLNQRTTILARQNNANINYRDGAPLRIAITTGDYSEEERVSFVRVLLSLGADITLNNGALIVLAAEYGYAHLTTFLLDYWVEKHHNYVLLWQLHNTVLEAALHSTVREVSLDAVEIIHNWTPQPLTPH